MSNTMYESLQSFRSNFEPTIKAIMSSLTRTTTTIMDAYANIIDAPYTEVSDIDVKREDSAFLASLRHHHDVIMHSVIHELDMLQTIGKPRYTERYFNMQDGELVEVDKKNYAGLPDEDEGRVIAFGNAPEQ